MSPDRLDDRLKIAAVAAKATNWAAALRAGAWSAVERPEA